jgi:universal stress protein A
MTAMRMRVILCPIDFSDLSARELDVAAGLARVFGARLVLHHNRARIAPGLARAWDWEAARETGGDSDAEAERRMSSALASLPPGIAAEGVISSGPVAFLVRSLAERLPADLIVLGSHGWSSDEHASITEQVIAQAPCPVLTLHERGPRADVLGLVAAHGAQPPRAVVPTDFSPTARHALDYSFALARSVPLDLELLHVLPGSWHRSAIGEHDARAHLEATIPRDLRSRVTSCVRHGDPSTEILAHLAEARPQFAVLGEHARDLVHRLFTRDTTTAVAQRAACPVWIVPVSAPHQHAGGS